MSASFRRVAILGTGLIGGSFALALRKYAPDCVVIGWDKGHVLRHALERGAIHEGLSDLSQAVAGTDLIYMALPVGLTIELLPEVSRLAPSQALVTDASSTKRSVCVAAGRLFLREWRVFSWRASHGGEGNLRDRRSRRGVVSPLEIRVDAQV